MVPKQSDLTDMESLQKRIEELRRSLELEKMRRLSFIIGNRRVGVSVELYKPVHIILKVEIRLKLKYCFL